MKDHVIQHSANRHLEIWLNNTLSTSQDTAVTWVDDRFTSSPLIHGVKENGKYKKPNFHRFTKDYKVAFSGMTVYRDGPRRYVITGNSGNLPSLEDWQTDDLYNVALSRLNEKARGGLDLSIDLAESHQTVQMFKAISKLESYTKGLQRFVKGKYGALTSLADYWLQYQYGWRPLVQDVFDTVDLLQKRAVQLQRFKGSVTRPLRDFTQTDQIINGFNVPVFNKVKGKEGCKIVIVLTVPDWDLAKFTSLNPVSIAWELLPYSFVADWFFDIGSMLRNYETAMLYNSRFKDGYVSYLKAGTRECSTSFRGTANGYNVETHATRASYDFAYFLRQPLTSYPFPRPPTISCELGWQRLTSAASLLSQFLPKGRSHGPR